MSSQQLGQTDLCRIHYCATTEHLNDFFTKVFTGRPFKLTFDILTGRNDVRHVPPQLHDEALGASEEKH